MPYKNYIRKSFAVLLLAIFALCNTPTAYLHKLFANHRDFITKEISATNSPQINVAGIDCHCNSTVVIAPYVASSEIFIGNIPKIFLSHRPAKAGAVLVSPIFFFELRGPPATA